MIAPRWRVPAPPLRTGIVLASTLGVLAVTGLAWAGRTWLPLGEQYPYRAAVLFAATMVLAIGLVGVHHPFSRFGAANYVTTIRAMLVALLASLIGEPGPAMITVLATGVAILIAGLDGVDGWLARRSRMASVFGARFDMEVDAVLLLVLSILTWQYGKAGAWVLLIGLMRYVFVAAGWVLPWLSRPLRPTLRGRVICVVQMVVLSVAMAPWIPMALSVTAAAGALAALVWSFALDVRRLWRTRPT